MEHLKHCETLEHSPFDASISAFDAETSALDAETSAFGTVISALARSYSGIGDCGVGITPQMCI